MTRRAGLGAVALLLPSPALAHDGQAHGADPFALILLAASALLYLRGLRRPGWRAAAFSVAWLALAAALLPPLASLAHASFLAHMVEHELLMLVAAPLLVLARPLPALLRALPHRWRRAPVALGRSWRFLAHPVTAFALHGAALWVWHAPLLFQAALEGEAAHWPQHASFFLTGLLYWWSLLGRHRTAAGTAVVSLFLTATHSGVLGALMTFSGSVWYARYGGAFGLTALEDQQLAGLVMWIPAGSAYMAAALALLGRWLGRSEGRRLTSS